MLRALALASAVTGASIAASTGAEAAPQTRWVCKDDLPPGRAIDMERCAYEQFPLAAPGSLPDAGPQPGPGPGPGPSPGPTPYAS